MFSAGGGALALLHDQVINFSFNKINKCFELLFAPLCIIEGLISNLMNKKSSLSIYFKYSYNLTNEAGGLGSTYIPLARNSWAANYTR